MRRHPILVLVFWVLLGWIAPGRSQDSTWTTGHKSVLVMRVCFPDDPTEPGTAEEAASSMAEVVQFFRDNSYDRMVLEPIMTPLLVLPRAADAYVSDPSRHLALREDALGAAQSAGFDPGDYDLDIVLNARWFGSRANIGARGCWMQFPQSDALIHELGHNFGLGHANLWIGRGDTIIGPGRMLPYGNMLDAMADVWPGAWPDRHFNVAHKHLLDWLPSNHTLAVTQSGDYRLWAADVPSLAPDRVYALRIPKDSDREYWLECRQEWKSNPRVQNGLLLYFGPWSESAGTACLLDTTPNSHWADDSMDAPLLLGRTFSDAESGLHITPLNRGSDGAVWMDLRIVQGRFPDNRPPVIRFDDGPVEVAPGLSVQLQVSVEDPDGDEVALSWDFGDGAFAAGTNGVAKAWSTAGDYLVRCWASDMRGGQRCAFRPVRVGQPAPGRTGRVTGRVTNQGQPAPGVRISVTDSLAVYSDADGLYTAVGLTNGQYQLHPGGAYLTFQPASRFVVIDHGEAAEQDFEAAWTAAPNNPPYVVTWNPGPVSVVAAPATIALRAWAYDDGEVSMVQFQDDTGLASLGLGNSFVEVWTNLWTDITVGEHIVTARALDDFGAVGQAWPARVVVVPELPRIETRLTTVTGEVALSLSGPAGLRLTVEASSDLVEWSTMVTVTNETGQATWIDPEAGQHERRFYRVRSED